MSHERSINKAYCTDRLRVDYAHVGLYDVAQRKTWIAKKAWGVVPIRISHARMLQGGSNDASVADKDRFLCYWFHTPNTGQGYVHGYPIEWSEGHLLVRIDPNWSYATSQFIPATETTKIDRNLDQQYVWGETIFKAYIAMKPSFPISLHMIGPRATDSMFYVMRSEG